MTYQANRTNESHQTLWVLMLFAYLLLPLGAVAQINIKGKVFGGARQADVQGHTFVHIGAEKHDVVIDYVFGGNDIAGTIGSSENIPTDITKADENDVDNSWNAFIKLSDGSKKVYIGQLFGGGYGDYTYDNETIAEGKKRYDAHLTYTVWDPALNSGAGGLDFAHPVTLSSIVKPELGKTYLEICGGSIVYAYGGGNNVTVTDNTTICYDNPSTVVNSIKARNADGTENETELLTEDRFIEMGINTKFSQPSSDEFQVGRFFGGNNKADMAIRPMWYLQQGKIRNLYSGGNEGRMISPVGLLLEINPKVPDGLTYDEAKAIKDKLVIDNVYGGCRRADVRPLNPDNGQDMGTSQIQLPDLDEQGQKKYAFPAGLAARVLVYGGDINNVYGGNDITGLVYGGNAVGVYSSIRGSIYGGGNGSYPYTDNLSLKSSLAYGDFYYDPGTSSVDALNAFRPNAEQVSIRVKGTDALHPTVIGGAIYVGGNSATLNTIRNNPMVHLKVGSFVIAENVFLGNNGENMIKYTKSKHNNDVSNEDVLNRYKQYVKVNADGTADFKDEEADGYTPFSTMNLSDASTFSKYMDGCATSLMPSIVFDGDDLLNDRETYQDYSSYFGSLFCGGNVGSITKSGKISINFNKAIIVYDKVVGGCNNAYVLPTAYNAPYQGGIIGSEDERPLTLNGDPRYSDSSNNIKDRLELTFNGLKIQPMRMPIAGVDDVLTSTSLSTETKYIPMVWNTIKLGERDDSGNPFPVAWNNNTWKDADSNHTALYNSTVNRRFTGGNIYGGCCASGVVNGNVVININASVIDRSGEHGVFDIVTKDDETGEDKLYNDSYTGITPVSGVILGQQGMDVLGSALNVFGGGKGVDTEIWGSTTINLKRGYVFQIFGGSEMGAIGKRQTTTTNNVTTAVKDEHGNYVYAPNEKYSTYVNLAGSASHPGKPKSQDMSEDIAEAEFLYGGAFEGPIAGSTHISLGNGRIFNSFGGSCNANVQGHTETIIGANGFPYVRDYVYGGNDLGGKILGSADFSSRVRNDDVRSKVYNPATLTAAAYTEYHQGRIEKLFGGCYGVYDYKDELYRDFFDAEGKAKPGFSKPFLNNSFINFRPTASNNELNAVGQIYGAGQGYLGEEEEDLMQNSSYILIDAQTLQNYQSTEVFGAGECGGVGMGVNLTGESPNYDQASAIIDLISGQIKAAYGGSYMEGVTRRTVVNVPAGSTFRANNIFGGAYGTTNEYPCDVYEANVNWSSSDALVGNYRSGIYGGNNAYRRTLYSKVNINAPVYYDKENEYFATVYGAGYGKDTWSEYTVVNLNGNPDPTKPGARVYEVYGGGQLGRVMNLKSVAAWKTQADADATTAYTTALAAWNALSEEDQATTPKPQAPTPIDLSLGSGYTDDGLNGSLVQANALGIKCNTNVNINVGADVCGYMYEGKLSGAYAYGGGLGNANIPNSGDVYGTTFIGLLGGTVTKDLYAAGTMGSVNNMFKVKDENDDTKDFVATTNAYIKGGTARNVYGGGWQGSVGYHVGDITASPTTDIPGETNVVIGDLNGTSFLNGLPAIERNAYGGGEGGAVWGTSHITMNNGFIGYRHFNAEPTTDTDLATIQVGSDYYQEKIHDETWAGDGTNRLNDSGCIFGGGYIDNSSVDFTNVNMYGGHVRNSLFGGGEIAAIGRGKINASGENLSVRTLEGIYRPGKTSLELFDGHVHRNVFGGGRGYNNLGEGGTLFSDGYVFGQTEVHIHGGEVGTTEEVAKENGNVFGGGDIGYVYSAYEMSDGTFRKGVKSGVRYDGLYEGYYYEHDWDDSGNFITYGTERKLTEDCKVLIEPHCKVKTAVTINGHDYAVGDFVPTSDLNTLGKKPGVTPGGDDKWNSLEANTDNDGIIIHNAVFAGGNTSSGSARAYANATSVFGNATASIHDVYHRDLITIGTGHIGGLYGDGNLTFVDGYRGLNITNYGTDYYTISSKSEITIGEYHELPAREAAYYELRYKCVQACTDYDGTSYHPVGGGYTNASTLTADDILTLFSYLDANNDRQIISIGGVPVIITNNEGELVPNPEFWVENGVCSIYAGRIMNTIQRADFCGVFGSRMVLQGAQDRVPEVVDHTNYTINRVREVSLNKKTSIAYDAGSFNGNYFGIYNIVNYLGALTSDFNFGDETGTGTPNDVGTGGVRTSDNINEEEYKPEYTGQTFYGWKKEHKDDRKRNNGNSYNKVALASGVYLELTTEQSTGKELNEKVWGLITGVVELDLINVQTGIGGGFVYAKNVHGVRTKTNHVNTTLTALNAGAATRWDYEYSTIENDANQREWQTSGNFVHSTQTIIDDCYNVSGKYMGGDKVPAHYWYIKGSVYVYDQYISAYTGASNAYSETVDIPLTITAASHGTMKLLNVQPNRYAYYNTDGNKLGNEQKLVINDVTYYLNDPISYWDWYKLTKSERELFVNETYVVTENCKIGNTEYQAGQVLLKAEYDALGTNPTVYQKKENETEYTILEDGFKKLFHSSNNLSHDTGYILTYKVNNPTEWNTWYTKFNSATHEKNQTGGNDYNNGPTYRLINNNGELLGQRAYKESDIISQDVETVYKAINSSHIPETGQATFEKAYIVTQDINNAPNKNGTINLHEGVVIAKSDYTTTAQWPAVMAGSVTEAFISTKSIQLSKTEFIYINSKMSGADRQAYIDRVNDEIKAIPGITDAENITTAQIDALSAENKKKLSELQLLRADIQECIVPAYYCTKEGLYGGNYYEGGKNYRGLEAWSSMSEADRNKFIFNYDALDLLIDPNYGGAEGYKYQYDDAAATKAMAEANPAGYSLTQNVDYTATYHGTEELLYTPDEGGAQVDARDAAYKELSRTEYESLPNEQRHYAPITVNTTDLNGGECKIYVVNDPSLILGNTPYAVGSTIPKSTYDNLGDEQSKVTVLTFTAQGTYYYCREEYPSSLTTESLITNVGATGTISNGHVQVGAVIGSSTYNGLPNKQKNFTIHGIAPTETSTFYVSRFSDIKDLSKEKIITVVYEYNYEESDAEAKHITPISERHVVNIHILFKSGLPEVEDIRAPQIIIPGDFVGLREPVVIPGANEITGGGWELYERSEDAESRSNAIPYTPNLDPLYWYQDGYWVRYYCLTNIGGKSYSNAVQVKVANYHDLKKVIEAKTHHYYIDNPNVKRDPKIYINDGTNGAQQLKDLFDLSMLNNPTVDEATGLISGGTFDGHAPLNSQVEGCQNLEFIMHTNVNHTGEWEPIANTNGCFAGTLHGDGYYFNGLNNSLFGHLCGSVYNLGVMGSFTGAGVADTGTGYVENCWINTTGTPDGSVKAVFGNPSATSGTKIVNCYYPNTLNYSTADNSRGLATPMEPRFFHNGTVAYDLNGFYLYKRYYDKTNAGSVAYQYYDGEIDPTTNKLKPKTEYYGQNVNYCSSGAIGSDNKTVYLYGGYVEDRFADGDFRYASGEIPATEDERFYTYKDTQSNEDVVVFYPIWPDDYIYFGQMLTYGWNELRPHEEVPSPIVKNSGRLAKTDQSNRVYRAPAYYRNSTMDATHFNPAVNLVAYSKPENAADINLHPAYPNMTAIDFAGHGDTNYTLGRNASNKALFYQPLLDDDGLISIVNRDETPNLVVYAPSATTNLKTYTVLNGYFTEPAYADYQTHPTYEPATTDYRCVDPAPTETVFGHLVQSSLTTTNDHLLVDMKDFNCPIDYYMGNSNHMWYQRVPKTYVDLTKGWESVSLPFKAELVTTNQKGEITHFYSGSKESNNGTKIGHEYWLHEYDGIKESTSGNKTIATASFDHPESTSGSKTVDNTFLWDYYYNNSNASSGDDHDYHHQDKNHDTYQTYYNSSRTYNGYPLLANGTPYLIGFPGSMYYEFDLSGTFEALTTADNNPEQIGEQTISFVSDRGYHVGVSDTELRDVTFSGYAFHPSYMNEELAAGTSAYTLKDDGSRYDKVPATGDKTSVVAFRPYFVKATSGSREADYILFDNANSSFGDADSDPSNGEVPDGTLYIYAKTGKVVVESSLRNEADVSIYTTSGLLVSSFTIKPGETIETPINLTGIYITRAANGHFTKKLKVKR